MFKDANPFNKSNAVGKDSTKCTSKGGHRKKYCNTKRKFVSLVKVG